MSTTFTSKSDRATERSTFVITAAFADEEGSAVIPSAVTWSLTDSDGTIINSRDAEAVSPAASVDIVLSGDDLALSIGDRTKRILLIEATYSSSLGTGLPLKDECIFYIDNLIGVS